MPSSLEADSLKLTHDIIGKNLHQFHRDTDDD